MMAAASPLATSGAPRTHAHDLLKGVAVLLMMQVHVVELLATQEWMDGFVGQLASTTEYCPWLARAGAVQSRP